MHASSSTVQIEAWSESQTLTLHLCLNTSQGRRPCIWVGALLATGFAVLRPSSSFHLHALDSFFLLCYAAYANNQWNLGSDVGADLADTSFARAMKMSRGGCGIPHLPHVDHDLIIDVIEAPCQCWMSAASAGPASGGKHLSPH